MLSSLIILPMFQHYRSPIKKKVKEQDYGEVQGLEMEVEWSQLLVLEQALGETIVIM